MFPIVSRISQKNGGMEEGREEKEECWQTTELMENPMQENLAFQQVKE